MIITITVPDPPTVAEIEAATAVITVLWRVQASPSTMARAALGAAFVARLKSAGIVPEDTNREVEAP